MVCFVLLKGASPHGCAPGEFFTSYYPSSPASLNRCFHHLLPGLRSAHNGYQYPISRDRQFLGEDALYLEPTASSGKVEAVEDGLRDWASPLRFRVLNCRLLAVCGSPLIVCFFRRLDPWMIPSNYVVALKFRLLTAHECEMSTGWYPWIHKHKYFCSGQQEE